MASKSSAKSRKGRKNLTIKKILVFVLVLIVASVAVYYGAKLIDNYMADGQSKSFVDSAMVGISDSSFDPETITIKNGQSITWTNTTAEYQDMTLAVQNEDGVKILQNTDGSIPPNETFSYTFSSLGTYIATVKSGDNQFSSTIIVKE